MQEWLGKTTAGTLVMTFASACADVCRATFTHVSRGRLWHLSLHILAKHVGRGAEPPYSKMVRQL